VIKIITGIGELLAGKVLLFDAQTMQSRIIKLGTKTKTQITSLAMSINVPTIAVSVFKQNTEAYELIDVRKPEERDVFNIGGRHIPLSEMDFDELSFLNGKSAVLYCSSGKRSAEAVKKILQKNSSAKVFSLEGGLKAWNEAG
jgi:adenylyltransferase/sulfurtransferase